MAKLPTPVATEQEYDTNLARFGTKMDNGVRPSIATHVRRLQFPCSVLGAMLRTTAIEGQLVGTEACMPSGRNMA